MCKITLFGPAVSSYVRTARWACSEKGVAHDLKPIELGSANHRELHPFCKVPVMQHGDFTLPESLAIVSYVDSAFDGPNLIPLAPRARAEALKWVSHINAYLYRRIVADYALKIVLPSFRGEEPNRAEVEAGLPGLREGFDVLEAGVGDSGFFVGDELSIADLFVAPVVSSAASLPEAAVILETKPNLKRFMETIGGRAAWKAALPGG